MIETIEQQLKKVRQCINEQYKIIDKLNEYEKLLTLQYMLEGVDKIKNEENK